MSSEVMRKFMKLTETADTSNYQLYADTNEMLYYIPKEYKETVVDAMSMQGSGDYSYLDPETEISVEETDAQPVPVEELQKLHELMVAGEDETDIDEEAIERQLEIIASYGGEYI